MVSLFRESGRPELISLALILVDPPMDSCADCALHNAQKHPRDKSEKQVTLEGKPSPTCTASCLVLEDPTPYETR